MNPWLILAWVASISLSVVVVVIAAAITVNAIRTLGRQGKTMIYRGKGDRR